MTGTVTFHPPRTETNGVMGYVPGVLMCVVGLAAIAFPILSSLAVEMTTAVAFLAFGLIGIVAFFQSGMRGEFAIELMAAILYLIMGVVLLTDPLAGVLSMTLFVSAAFIVAGVSRCIAAFRMKSADGWGWVLANGVVSLLLGVMLGAQFPFSGLWALGLLVGMNLLFSGMTAILVHAAATASDGDTNVAPATSEDVR